MTVDYYNEIKDFIHPNITDNIEHYSDATIIELPPYHGYNSLN